MKKGPTSGNSVATKKGLRCKPLIDIRNLVGTAGFEPATTTPPVWCATRLRYAPKVADYTQLRRSCEVP